MSTENEDIDDFDNENIGEDIDIEFVDDEFSQGEADAGKPIAEPDTSDEDISDDELAHLPEGVQKRIKKGHAIANAERRAKEQKIKENEELLRVARELQNQVKQEREQRLTYTQAAVSASRRSLEQEVKSLTQDVREAMESGDPDKQILSQTKLNAVVQQLNGIPTEEVLGRDIQQQRERPMPDILPAAPQEEVQAWIQENAWFQENPQLRDMAIQSETYLVQNFGMRAGAKATLDKVSSMVRATFPDLMGTPVTTEPSPPPPPAAPPPPKAPPAGMPVMRSAPGGKKIVRLTAAQVNIANELGISVAEYAKEYASYNKA